MKNRKFYSSDFIKDLEENEKLLKISTYARRFSFIKNKKVSISSKKPDKNKTGKLELY